MFGTIGGPELFLILVVALIVFGPTRLPEIGKSLGKAIGEFRKATSDAQHILEHEVDAEKNARRPALVKPAEEPSVSPVEGIVARGSAPETTPKA